MLMKTLAYLECPTGIAGDMCLGALVHAGVPLSYLKDQLARLGIARRVSPAERIGVAQPAGGDQGLCRSVGMLMVMATAIA